MGLLLPETACLRYVPTSKPRSDSVPYTETYVSNSSNCLDVQLTLRRTTSSTLPDRLDAPLGDKAVRIGDYINKGSPSWVTADTIIEEPIRSVF